MLVLVYSINFMEYITDVGLVKIKNNYPNTNLFIGNLFAPIALPKDFYLFDK